MAQEDTRPTGGNDCGDACECEGDVSYNLSVDSTDTGLYLLDLGRNQWSVDPLKPPCTVSNPCHGDLDCSDAVDSTDTGLYLQDLGRNPWSVDPLKPPCPACSRDGYPCVPGP